MTGTAQAEPAAAPTSPTASTQVVLAAATTIDPEYRRWCQRTWHKPTWEWWHGKRHFKPGYWTCEWQRPGRWH